LVGQLVSKFLIRANCRNRAVHLVSATILVLIVYIEANEEGDAKDVSGKRGSETQLSRLSATKKSCGRESGILHISVLDE